MLSCFLSWGLLALAPGVPTGRLSPIPSTGITTPVCDSALISLLPSPLTLDTIDRDGDAEGVGKRMART